MLLSSAYEQLIAGQRNFFIVDAGGHIRETLKGGRYDIIPGSFDPLHDAHRWMFQNNASALFEMSVRRWDKPDVDLATLERKLLQFRGYASVLVTNAPRMLGKIGVIRSSAFIPYWDSLAFHIGMDTYARMAQDYVGVEMAGLSAKFVVYDRIVNGERLTLPAGAPFNCVKALHQMPEHLLSVSSTALRNKV